MRAAAAGDLVEYGTFKGSPLYWRILSMDSKRIVALSRDAVIAGAFQSNEQVDGANDYSKSSVREWLKTVFVPAAFGNTAPDDPVLGRSSATDVVSGDIAFLLTPSQLDRYLPEADDRIAGSSAWAEANTGYGSVPLASGPVYWWLAPEPGTAPAAVAPVVQTNGAINGLRYTAVASDGVRPAIKLNVPALKLTLVTGSSGIYRVSAK